MEQQNTPLAALAAALREAEDRVYRLTWPYIILGPDLTEARAMRDALRTAHNLLWRANEARGLAEALAQPDMLALPTEDYIRACNAISRAVNTLHTVQS